jgi:hypothetical protein
MIKRLWTVLPVIVFCMMFVQRTVLAADKAYFTADKTAPLIGEPVQLILHLQVPQQAQVIVPNFKNWQPPFFVQQVGALTVGTPMQDGSVEYELPLTLVLWQTGQLVTPPLDVSYQLNGTTINLPVESFQFVVPSVLSSNDLSLRPFKPQIDLPYFPIWIAITGIPIAVTLIVLGMRYRFFRRHFQIPTVVGSKWHPDASVALNTLKQIGQSQADPPAIYIQVSDCLRHYLDARFAVHSVDLTTSELLDAFEQNRLVTEDQQDKLIEMLRRADLVKFAQVVPKNNAAQQYASVAAQWIQSVEQMRGAQS